MLRFVLPILLWSALAAADTAREWNDRGLARLKQERYPEAVAAFERALQLSPGSPVLLKNLASAHAEWGVDLLDKQRSGPAIARLRRAIEIYKGDPGFNLWLAVAYYRNGNLFDATVELRYVLEREPKRHKAWEYLGYCYYQRNRLAQAIAAWEKALALAPGDENIRGWLAKVRRESKVESGYQRHRGAHFDLLYDAEGEAAATVVREMLEDAYRELGAELGIYPRSAVTVVLYPKRAFYSVTGSHQWVGGLFDGKIRLPVQNLRARTPAMARVVRHEYAHVLVATLAPRCPVWLNEGIAQLVEGGDHRAQQSLAAGAQRAGKLMPFASLGGSFNQLGSAERVRLAYAQSWSFAAYLDRLYGRRTLAAVLEKLGQGLALDAGVKAVYKLTLAELVELWRRTL